MLVILVVWKDHSESLGPLLHGDVGSLVGIAVEIFSLNITFIYISCKTL